MIADFINDLKCIREDEKFDYRNICNILSQKNNTVLFMPAITWYGGTINLIDQNSGSDTENMIWLVPAGQGNFYWLKNGLKRTVMEFYASDEIEMARSSYFPGTEVEEFEECILLHSDVLQSDFENTVMGANVIFMRFSLSSGRDAFVYILLDHQDQCWKNIIEGYHISLSWLIDSGRGMGDYFVLTNLYKLMKQTAYPEILPQRYFKGLYNKGEVPKNFKFSYAMLSQLDADGYDKWKAFSSVFDANWNG